MGSNANSEARLTIQETDEADNPTVTYIFSGQDTQKSASSGGGRVDILDSLQAFCSSIAGLLSSRAVLQGVGVGNADASPTSALLLHILQDTSGRIATILFAHRVGTALEPECKTYRLAADVFNDFAMILDCLSPMVPAGFMRVSILSAAGVLRALCGVAGGSSKASLSAHFAKWGNLAELNAVGSVVVSHVTRFTTTWIALLTLLALHLSLNYAAVRSVQMTSLNRQRANIVLSALFESDTDIDLTDKSIKSKTEPSSDMNTSKYPQAWKVLTPAQVASQERIFHRGGALQWTSLSRNTKTYLGSAEIDTHSPQTSQDVFDVVASVLDVLNRGERFGGYVAALKRAGWDVDVGALETRGGRRVSFE
ncbi:RUS1 family protein -like protein [Penicillium subrubescens]|uniref:RUS1 family protein-like protein n=1 Tax=Penicillium subrubescens TaxID=1316194 RepID=A0A1Q5T0Z2_9EURO|nr:RUS1 family protein -like protein [Penicillium subrubescens]